MLTKIKRTRRWMGALVGAGVAFGLAGAPAALAQTAISWGKPSEVLSTDPHLSGDGTSWTVFTSSTISSWARPTT
jgi:peptide/nickel transport system substrate-binding protein